MNHHKHGLKNIICCLGLASVLIWPGFHGVSMADDADEAVLVLSRQAVKLLAEQCFACHGAEKQEGSLRLDSRRAILSGGDRGPAMIEGDDEGRESLILQSVRFTDEDLQMPPKKPLGQADVALLERWIAEGAHWPESGLTPESKQAVVLGDAFTDENNPIRRLYDGKRLDLWSLRPIVRPPIPEVVDSAWSNNPIDRFLQADWEPDGLRPVEQTDMRTLGIRSAMDLMGVPPTFAEVEGLVNDAEPGAYDRWIDRLMASPDRGIHLARMWLDVVRYSDSNGFDWDEFRPQAWRFRDYVIRAMNEDLPFDDFVRQQLAGDELLDGSPRYVREQDCLIATGYLRLGPHDNAAPAFNEQDRSHAELLTDLTETTASGFMGLTMSCCRCHDHKTDPLSQADHYRLRDFFAAVEFADETPLELQSEREAIDQHNAAIDAQVATLNQERTQLEEAAKKRRNDHSVKANGTQKSNEDELPEEELVKLMTAAEKDRFEKLNSMIQESESAKKSHTHGLLMTDKVENIPQTYVLYQGDYRAPRDAVAFGFPSVLFPNQPDLIEARANGTSGRRLTLADWIISRDNPWTARVIVNRLWQMHFGRGLVETASDFGLSGAKPNHPELLDWLAAELVHSGWSLKHIQQLVVTSQAYRMRPAAKSDMSRGLVSTRTEMRRKSAEQLRDSLLAVSGLLQNRAGGSPVWPELDPEILQANPAFLDDNATKTKGWYPSPETEQTVRSIYLVQKRTVRIPWMETFDLPENSVTCPRRESSIVAPQALSMMNGVWSRQAAVALAESVSREEGKGGQSKPEALIRRCFQSVFHRNPSTEEIATCRDYLESRSLEELCLVLLNANEFAFVE